MQPTTYLIRTRREQCTELKQSCKKQIPALLKKSLKIHLSFTPKWLTAGLIQSQFNLVLKKQLEEGDFDFLAGKWLKIIIEDLNFNWLISLKNQTFIVEINNETQIFSAKMSGNSVDLIKILTQQIDADTLFFQRKLVIEGNTEFALEVKNTLDSIDLNELPKPYAITLQKLGSLVEHFSI